jgi:DNA (cytosine-5)-methyltransferase 1
LKPSAFTVTDLFCGAGGSSLGAAAMGCELRMAVNHWPLAIETHSNNFPQADHDCNDVSGVDPRRYPSTNILIASPECTNHSLAKGARRKNLNQGHLFNPAKIDPAEERSRATMWDVPRFAEYHDYDAIIVENVVDARHWLMWDAWLHSMDCLGYRWKLVSLNSMFCFPTPQSRDRLYIVFWKKGNPTPDLDFRPPAPCPRCGVVEAIQTWKRNSKTGNPNDVGRYRKQYIYTCPRCRAEVTPFYYAALNAIDWSIPAARIGDRPRPLKPRTLDRIKYGLEKFGRTPLLVITNMTTDKGRTRPVTDPHFVQTGSSLSGLVSPFLVETTFGGRNPSAAASAGAGPVPTQTTRQSMGMVMPFLVAAGSRETAARALAEAVPTLTGSERFGVTFPGTPFFIHTRRNDLDACRVRPGDDPLGTTTGSGTDFGVTFPAPFLTTLRGTANDQLPSTPVGLDEAIGTISAGGRHHALIQGAALMTLRDHPRMLLNELTDPCQTQLTGQQAAVISREPFLVQYYGTGHADGVSEPMAACTTLDRHGLVEQGQELDVDDCHFRMLVPHEIQSAMAFPGDYRVLGNARDKVKQLGNAVTPPAMSWLYRQTVASLHPEVAP